MYRFGETISLEDDVGFDQQLPYDNQNYTKMACKHKTSCSNASPAGEFATVQDAIRSATCITHLNAKNDHSHKNWTADALNRF